MKMAGNLQNELSQHLVGSLLAAHALSMHLSRRHAPEAPEAAYLVELLKSAIDDVKKITAKLDTNKIQ